MKAPLRFVQWSVHQLCAGTKPERLRQRRTKKLMSEHIALLDARLLYDRLLDTCHRCRTCKRTALLAIVCSRLLCDGVVAALSPQLRVTQSDPSILRSISSLGSLEDRFPRISTPTSVLLPLNIQIPEPQVPQASSFPSSLVSSLVSVARDAGPHSRNSSCTDADLYTASFCSSPSNYSIKS